MGERLDRFKENYSRNVTIEKVKEHIIRNKVAYSCGATAIGVAGITCLLMRSNAAQRGASGGFNAQRGLTNTASFTFGSRQTINVTSVLDREGRGHPGWPVKNLESNRIFFSQREAAKAFAICEGILSGHLIGKFPDVNGLHFERVNLLPSKSQE